jgi:hypothetical protein
VFAVYLDTIDGSPIDPFGFFCLFDTGQKRFRNYVEWFYSENCDWFAIEHGPVISKEYPPNSVIPHARKQVFGYFTV